MPSHGQGVNVRSKVFDVGGTVLRHTALSDFTLACAANIIRILYHLQVFVLVLAYVGNIFLSIITLV